VLFGDELSDGDITKIMEDRWFVPLKKIKTVRPLVNNSAICFERRLVGDEVDEDVVAGIVDEEEFDPLRLFKDQTNWKPPRPSTPVHFSCFDTEPEYKHEYLPKVMHEVHAGPHLIRLLLPVDAPMEKVIEVMGRRTGITGRWEGRVLSEADEKMGKPRVIKLKPKEDVKSPAGLPPEISEARVFFGTL
jgi:hypothetical protein